ncbi:MAG: helix-turn-helix domain-containing protein [Eubacteriales bacterium]
MFNMKSVGMRIARMRKDAHLTQMEIANKLGVSYQAISNWERGVAMPDIANLSPLAEALSVTVDDIINDDKILKLITENKIPDEGVTVEEFNNVSPLLQPEENRRMFASIKVDGNPDQTENISVINVASLDCDDDELRKILFDTCESGDVALFSVLLQNIDVSDNDVNALLGKAFDSGNVAIFSVILNNCDISGETAEKYLGKAFDSGNVAIFSVILNNCDISDETAEEYLGKAFESEKTAIFSVLISSFDFEKKVLIQLLKKAVESKNRNLTAIIAANLD